jgi:hypothetical protein
MNKITQSLTLTLFLAGTIVFTGCEQKVAIESVVHPDGTIDRTVVFTEVDSALITRNVFGINDPNLWKTTVQKFNPEKNDHVNATPQEKVTISFSRHFASVEDANSVMDVSNDTLFRIHSEFEKKFRWFYTYLEYSDTYLKANRFRYLPEDQYFNKEDHAFIDRLPAEGKSISKADSIFLEGLTQKLGDYFSLALFEEHYAILKESMKEANTDKRWHDSLSRHKGEMYASISKIEKEQAVEDAFMIPMLENLKIGFPVESISQNYRDKYKQLKPRIDFMTSIAAETKFTHSIRMPWSLTATNADSVRAEGIYWQPMTIKFLLTDYTMYAHSRKLNVWAVAISFVLIVMTIWMFTRKKPLVN